MDRWLNAVSAYGKPAGLKLVTYNGICCGGDGVPPHIYQAQPEAQLVCEGWSIPRYWSEAYLAAYSRFISEAGKRYDNDPRVVWMEISTGIFGENKPADREYLDCVEKAGLTSDLWVQTEKRIIDIYLNAFPNTQLLLQYAPAFKLMSERRELTDYAAARGVGLKHNGLVPDADATNINRPGYSFSYAGQYDPMFKWWQKVPIAWESYEEQYMTGLTNTIWGVLSGLDKHADYFVFAHDLVTKSDRRPILEFALRHLGKTIADSPSAWVAMRETELQWYPQFGNYDFFMVQNDQAPGGRSVAMWSVSPYAEGRYTRRTDSATGNPYFYFDIENGYLLDTHERVRLTVTYYDKGLDSFDVLYDAWDSPSKLAGTVRKTNTGQWLKASWTLTDARFGDRQPGGGQHRGSDISLYARDDGDEVIHMVQVERLDLPLTPMPTPAPTLPYTPPPTTSAPAPTPVPTIIAPELHALRADVMVDGHLNEWGQAEALPLDHTTASYWSGSQPSPSDLSGVFRMQWDDDTLYFAVQVKDDRSSVDSNPDVWHDDGIEIGLDGENDDISNSSSAGDHQFTVRRNGSIFDRGSPTTLATAAIRESNGGYTVEGAIPAAALGGVTLGTNIRLGFNLGLNDDDDGGGRDSSLIWRGRSTYGGAEQFGTLVLIDISATSTPTPAPTSGSGSTPAPTNTSVSTPGADFTPTSTSTPTPTDANAVTVRLSPEADTHFSQWFPLENYGNASTMAVQSLNVSDAFLRFPLQTIPAGAAILDADLHLTVISRSSLQPLRLDIYRLNRDWTEAGLTAIRASEAALWEQSGAAAVPADRSGETFGSGILDVVQPFVIDITPLAVDWLQRGVPNFGLLLHGEGMANVQYVLASREHANIALRPVLTISYRPAAFPASPTPTPSLTPTRPPTATVVPTSIPAPTRTPTPTNTVRPYPCTRRHSHPEISVRHRRHLHRRLASY